MSRFLKSSLDFLFNNFEPQYNIHVATICVHYIYFMYTGTVEMYTE